MRSLILVTLLMYSVYALHWEKYKEVSSGNELEESSGDTPAQGLPGMCWVCKWTMKKVKKQLSNGATQDEIKQKLLTVCNEIGFLKSVCKRLMGTYVDTLIEELSTSDDPKTICVNISVCK